MLFTWFCRIAFCDSKAESKTWSKITNYQYSRIIKTRHFSVDTVELSAFIITNRRIGRSMLFFLLFQKICQVIWKFDMICLFLFFFLTGACVLVLLPNRYDMHTYAYGCCVWRTIWNKNANEQIWPSVRMVLQVFLSELKNDMAMFYCPSLGRFN